jgi:hypothetical protein
MRRNRFEVIVNEPDELEVIQQVLSPAMCRVVANKRSRAGETPANPQGGTPYLYTEDLPDR